ncbi:hypothetical protein [Archangium primigenium]|uniref:hypothetical protein n=1 Tax=[Archangium] primigenium TaxID=2792470 RepID=UPI00195E2B7C|nr:hypothetical protein [Archangium primigenium]MBM7115735.1 hypothetical protein [Archangium primigenium]
MTRIHDLLDLPEAVRKGDFVQDLTGGIAQPERTVKDYAITPKIVQTFEHALSIIGSALRDSRSQAAYLHGSFGAGKSHFMALLDLMLADHPAPWRRAELHELRGKNPWIGKKKLLQLPIHMLGAQDMESKILGSYVAWAAKHHPDAPVPAVYADQGLFDDARRLRITLGDDTFFGKLNGGVQQAATGWGKLAEKRKWDAASFDAAASATYVGESDRDAQSPRAKLFSDLVRTFFTSWTSQQGRFVDLDTGLGVMSRHARSLGFDAIVLYLDELVLWLAGNSSDLPFVGREVQKMVKLKEAQDADRAIPIVSFIARQRDLSQFLGEQAQGAVRTELSRNLSHHDGRFETVTLADSNLPAIVAHRVVRPKDDSAAQRLADDFAKTWRAAGQAQSVLIGSEGDEADFKKVYPFSPALVEALVALSDCLQRERTAIRILMELLVNHLPDLETGRVVPVGDAFDALAESEDPIDDPVMKARFDRARDLYRESFLPIIRRQHNTDTPSACQRLREDHDRRLGCSGCTQRTCRNDNRLAKTLLMAALVPEARPFKGLTVKRLAHLNHGTIASPIPGAEMQVVAQRLRDWASQIGALRLGEQADPEVSIHLAGIDLQPILAQAAEADTPGARKATMRRLLFQALELNSDGTVVETELTFYGTRRKGRIRYGNVREMDETTLTCPRELEWQLIVDYPFDERGHGPDEDLRTVERYRDSRPADAPPNPTVVWLPTFFSHSLERELGELVVLEHILDGDARKYLGHLRVEDQSTTRADLASLRAQKEALVKRTLAQAYGLAMANDSAFLDQSRTVDEHFIPLLGDLDIRTVLAGTMKEGFRQVVDTMLSKKYPHHPRFDGTVSATRMERVGALVEKLLDERERRMNVERGERNDLRAYADPLGITETGDVAVLLRERSFQDIEQQRQQAGMDTPTVGNVRGWLDPQRTRGLPPEVQDVLISLYASWSGRTFRRDGRSFAPPRPGQFPDDVELLRPELPTLAEWTEALNRAGDLLGVAIGGRALGARNLSAFADKVKEALARVRDARDLPAALEPKIRDWAEPGDAPRLATARACATLLELLGSGDGASMVRDLASFAPTTSLTAMERNFRTAAASKRLLEEDARWIVLRQVKGLLGDAERGERAKLLLQDLAALLTADEVNKMLADGLADLTRRADELLRVPTPKPPRPPVQDEEIVLEESSDLGDAQAAADALRKLAKRLETEGKGASRIVIRITAWKRRPE